MILNDNKALGIDITESFISMALLKKDKKGIKLLKTASGPVPEGAIKNGIIENPAVLAKAVKKLKHSSRMKASRTAVSLFTQPTVMQIMDIPRQLPSNLSNFIYEQVKHYAVLLGKKIAFDFCSISPVSSDTDVASHVLTVATDGQQVSEIINTLNKIGISAEEIEQPLLSCIRTLYAENIEGKFDTNVLIAVLRENCLTLCVFRKQTIDLVRTRDISAEEIEPQQFNQWLSEQINTVIQSYEIDSPGSRGQWDVVVLADGFKLDEDTEDILRANVARTGLKLITSDNLFQTGLLSQFGVSPESKNIKNPSLPAIGLGLKLLGYKSSMLGANLNPPEVIKIRNTQKKLLLTANITAAALFLILLAIHGPAWKVNKLNEHIFENKLSQSQNMQLLVVKRDYLNKKSKALRDNINRINTALGSRREYYWPDVFSEIARSRPKTIRITSFAGGTEPAMILKGLAISNQDVYLFVDTLNKSQHIESAQIIETKKDGSNFGLVSYEIKCTLNTGKGV